MSRSQIFEGIFATLQADAMLATILGATTAANPRLMRGYPQLQALLATGYEPASGDAWLVFQEPQPYPAAAHASYESAWEVIEIAFSVFSVQYAMADAVIDQLDTTWHWSLEQQRAIQYGERILLRSRRYRTEEAYAQELKLPQKSVYYRMSFTLETQHA